MSASVAPAASSASLIGADLLDLRPHVAHADAVAIAVARRLAGDEDLPRAAHLDDHHLGIEDFVAVLADVKLFRLYALPSRRSCVTPVAKRCYPIPD